MKKQKSNTQIQIPTKKEMQKYLKHLKKEAKNFRVYHEDLSNLTDLYYIMTPDVYDALELNKMDKWFDKFFTRVQRITLPELYKSQKNKKLKRWLFKLSSGFSLNGQAHRRLKKENTGKVLKELQKQGKNQHQAVLAEVQHRREGHLEGRDSLPAGHVLPKVPWQAGHCARQARRLLPSHNQGRRQGKNVNCSSSSSEESIMAEIEIISEHPLTLQEVRERLETMKKRDKELHFRANKVIEYLDAFAGKKQKDITAKKKALIELSIGRLRDRHIAKILDIMPEDLDSLKAILAGENVTLKQDDLKKILETVQA